MNHVLIELDRVAAEFCKQRSESIYDLFVRRAVRGDQPVAILNLRHIVVQRYAKQVSHSSTSFSQDQLRRASVPLFCSRRKMDVNVALLFDEQSDLYPNRATLYFFTKSETLNDLVHARTPVRSACRQTHFREVVSARNVHLFRID